MPCSNLFPAEGCAGVGRRHAHCAQPQQRRGDSGQLGVIHGSCLGGPGGIGGAHRAAGCCQSCRGTARIWRRGCSTTGSGSERCCRTCCWQQQCSARAGESLVRLLFSYQISSTVQQNQLLVALHSMACASMLLQFALTNCFPCCCLSSCRWPALQSSSCSSLPWLPKLPEQGGAAGKKQMHACWSPRH